MTISPRDLDHLSALPLSSEAGRATLLSFHRPQRKSASANDLALVTPAEYDAVHTAYRNFLPYEANLEPNLLGVLEDTLSHPGRLVRAQLAFSLVTALGQKDHQRTIGWGWADGLRIGIAVEYFHTASLIFDDMPNMDNAQTRRGFPCVHLSHGEAAATLGALAFITRGYELLWSVFAHLPSERSLRASSLVTKCVGLPGALSGQSLDVHFGGDVSPEAVLDIAERKTVSLLRLALALPGVVTGAAPETQDRLEEVAEHWGLAYQALDDFKDLLCSEQETGKTTGRDRDLGRPSLPAAAGTRPAFEMTRDCVERAGTLLQELYEAPSTGSSPLEDRIRSLRGVQTQLETEVERVARALEA